MADKIMVVRHAEKPDKADDTHGVDSEGQKNKKDLAPRGWQRSGALVRFFAPFNGNFAHPVLATPTSVFAASPEDETKSERSLLTVQGVADLLKLKVDIKFSKGQERKLADALLATKGIVLVGWEHKAIIDLANFILGNDRSSPQHWPDDRFDLVWIFDKNPGADLIAASAWKFTQVPQQVLPGDSLKII